MKFGSNLQRNQVPEWSSKYINYKGLKILIKAAAADATRGKDVDVAEIFYSLDRNLETIDEFYNKKHAEFTRRFKLLRERYQHNVDSRGGSTNEEIEDIIAALLELRSQLRKLQWYGEVNRRGFIKITKKLDKKVPSTSPAQPGFIALRVDPKAFATNHAADEEMNELNEWLSQLTERKKSDSSSSADSSESLSRSSTTSNTTLTSVTADDVYNPIRADDVNAFLAALEARQPNEKEIFHSLLLNALQLAISCRSQKCIVAILSRVGSLDDPDDIYQRNCLHRLALTIGRGKTFNSVRDESVQAREVKSANIVPAEAPNTQGTLFAMEETEPEIDHGTDDDAIRLLTLVLDNMTLEQRPALKSRDSRGRIALHYAAQYGFMELCQVIIDRMVAWNQFDISEGLCAPQWQDGEENSPLHLAVIGGHPKLTKYLLDCSRMSSGKDGQDDSAPILAKSSDLLIMATRANFIKIVMLLVEAGADVNYQDQDGETALHVAARLNRFECMKSLLRESRWRKPNLNLVENTFGWTPLMSASVEGSFEAADLLIESGAEVEKKDISGWTAKEHAALRGHLKIMELIAKHTPAIGTPTLPEHTNAASLVQRGASLEEKAQGRVSPPLKSPATTFKAFGHRYLEGESVILVSLGSMDQRKRIKPVELDNVPISKAHNTQLDTALSIIVSADGASGESSVIDLPVQESIGTEPIVFTTKDPTKVKLIFDLIPTYSGSKDRTVGRGVAVLSSIRQNLGSKRMNLQGDMSTPLIAAKTLDYIGSVRFTFLVITPFSHPNMSVNQDQTYWKKIAEPVVIGHRGLGKNTSARETLQLGENTIQSFIAAANLGASYVEFDVQLTKDHVPVIYHDFLVSETGVDAPVHTLTLEQFLHVSDQRTPRSSKPNSPATGPVPDSAVPSVGPGPRMTRANSLGALSNRETPLDMNERMKHTRDFKLKGFKGNSRGSAIQAPFTTLEEMLRKLPEHISFNIEMKYPMLFESEEQEMDTYAVELNYFVETVLNKVYDLAGKRNIIFSSFNPDICLLLSFKQPSIPILFLTDAGTAEVGDIRASSLQEAIRFASRWNLLGVVSSAEPLVACPRLVRVVKESGLVCVSYGTPNNDPKNVKLQVREGIDAVIVDSVLAIRKGLTAPDDEIPVEAEKTTSAAVMVESKKVETVIR